MRLLAFVSAFAALAALGLAGQTLWEVLQSPSGAQLAASVAVPDGGANSAPHPKDPPAVLRQWPALFGRLKVVEPQPPSPPTPPQPKAPPAPPKPPVSSLGYSLKGVLLIDGQTWAMVSHPTGDLILRIGDVLTEGFTVAKIDSEGLWLDSGTGQELLAFVE
jgi:hypothetical protein